MLAAELINTNIPRLILQDKVSKALQLINDFRITHLPVVADNIFLGLISEEDLIDVDDEKLNIDILQEMFLPAFVKENEHFLTAVNYCNLYDTTIVPVINKNKELLGVITTTDLLKYLGNFAGTNEIGGIIVLEMTRSQFAISEISRIVESNNATILHLNTTVNPLTGILTVTIHTNTKEISSIISNFERYEYKVIDYFGTEKFENDIKLNYQHLIHYLNL